jgi:hypothetical protein
VPILSESTDVRNIQLPELCEILLREFEDIIQKEKYMEGNIKNRISEKLMNKNFRWKTKTKNWFSLLCSDQSG